jgi:hypothetical protein
MVPSRPSKSEASASTSMTTSPEEHLPADQPTSQATPQPITSLKEALTRTLEEQLQEQEAGARQTIAHRLVRAYVVLLALSIVIPTALIWIPHAKNTFSVPDARDLILAMSGALSGLVGILGFVMGYYFKALDKSPGRTAPRTPSRRTSSATNRAGRGQSGAGRKISAAGSDR